MPTMLSENRILKLCHMTMQYKIILHAQCHFCSAHPHFDEVFLICFIYSCIQHILINFI